MERNLLLAGALVLSFAAMSAAQPSLTGAVNAASYLNATLPNGKLAPGVLFIGFGKAMGPTKLAAVTAFPLKTDLAGTEVSVTVGSKTVQCLMIYTSAGQLAAVLPSSTPAGTGTMTVSFNGQTSAPLTVTVVDHDFGIFAVNQGGYGQGIFTEALTSVSNSTTASANAKDLVDIWGTGIGAVAGDEAAGPLPGDMPSLNVQVFVGSTSAQVLYRGRSGCCTALDQIRIVIPSGITGCSIPVYVVVDGVPSNFTTISIAGSGTTCSDPSSLPPDIVAIAKKNGSLRVGSAALGHLHGFTQKTDNVSDTASVEFVKETPGIIQYSGPTPAPGVCYVIQFPGPTIGVSTSPLKAGTITLTGPVGPYTLAQVQAGIYGPTFDPAIPVSEPGLVNDGTLLKPGDYTFTGTAGADIGAFSVKVPFPSPMDWTNRPTPPVTIPRNQGLKITWTNGAAGALVQMSGQSQSSLGVGAQFFCWQDATVGSFTIPEGVMSSIPATYINGKVPQGALSVLQVFTKSSAFTAPGIDYGGIQWTDGFDMGAVTFQ
jgi:uncharacterized protein (TIGR03437 family)